MKNVLNFFLILLTCSAYAQDFNNYKPVQSQDKIPQELVTLSSDLYEKERKLISKKDKRFDKKAKDEFYLESSFELHDMLYNGRMIFNDPLTLYVQKVADEVFKTKPNIQNKIQIFVMKSATVNAFATNNGMIFITMGLLAQLENEAQLAFILSHEFTHYEKKHVVNGYVESKKIEKGKKDYRSLKLDDKINAKYKFNKDQEIEADIDGLDLYIKSKYSLNTLDGVFDVLEYEYLPFDDLAFDKTFFDTKYLKLPANLFLEKTKDITAPSDNDDTKSTHPSIFKRRKYISDKISKVDQAGRKNYIVSETEFKNIRKIARFELTQLYLTQQHYLKCIYNSYLLLKDNPKSLYLKKAIGKSLYALAKYKNLNKYDDLNYYPYDSIEGSSQQVYHLIETLKDNELSTLAIKYLWDLKTENPNDNEIPAIVEDLIKDAVKNKIIKKADYSTVEKEILKTKIKEEVAKIDSSKKELSKYDKIKKNQKVQKIVGTSDSSQNFVFYALIDEMKNKGFVELMDKFEKEFNTDKEDNETQQETTARLKAERKKRKEERKRLAKKGEALGIDKVVFINPHYLKVDERKEKALEHLESEEAQLVLNDEIRELAPLAGLQYEMIDDIGLKTSDVDKFNDFGYLNLWFQERSVHNENNVDLVALDKEKVDYLIKKYNTKYFCWSGFVGETEKSTGKGVYYVGAVAYFPIAPYMLYLAIKPDYQTYFYNVVYNLETGEAVHSKIVSMNYKDSQSLRRSQLYDFFYQLKQKDNSK